MRNFKIDGNTLKYYMGDEINVIVPDCVTMIDEYAFYDCDMRSIVLPEGLKEIGASAFCGCKQLKSITIPGENPKIGCLAFGRCESLEDLHISDKAELDECAFLLCKKLADEQGMIIVNNELFSCLEEAEHIVVPNGVKKIHMLCFFHYESTLKSIRIPGTVKEISPLSIEAVNNPNLTIIAPYFSIAHIWAKENNYKFKPICLERIERIIKKLSLGFIRKEY